MISPGIFFIVLKFSFFGLSGGGRGGGVKGQKIAQWKITITSVTHHISGTVNHMIMIFGTLVLNDDISRYCFRFFDIFIFWAVMGGGGEGIKRAKMFQNEEKLCVILHISGTINHRIIICGAQVWNNNIFRFYF